MIHRLPLLLSAVLLAPSTAHPTTAQAASWTQQGPLPTGLEVEAVDVRSATEAWAVSGGGMLLHTTDAGMTWTRQNMDTISLNEVFFLDDQHGWLVGNAIFRTTDGGATWEKSPAVTGSLYGVHFIDPLRGWATGSGVVYRTLDGGTTWEFVALPASGTSHGVFFLDALNGWAANINGDVFRSTDGGASWELDHTEGLNLNTVWFSSPTDGFVVGSQRVHRTTDGGATWTIHMLPEGTWTFSAFFLDGQRAWAVGTGGDVVATEDGWLTASLLATGGGVALWDTSFADASFGFAVGERGRILATADGGTTWLQRNSGGMDAHGIDATDPGHAWLALEQGDIAYTANGGAQWLTVPVAGFSQFGAVQDVDFLDDNLTGWVAGWDQQFGGDTGVVSKSTDGGRTWEVQYLDPGEYLYTIAAVDENVVLTSGLEPFVPDQIMRSGDGGATWTAVATGLGVTFDMDFPDTTRGWAVGGRILASADGGLTWTDQLTPDDAMEAVDFLDDQLGWTVGRSSLVYRTTNGGQTWTQVSDPLFGFQTFTGVSVVDAQNVWITGPGGMVYRTQDGGDTWTTEALPMGPGVLAGTTCGVFLDADFGWVGGGPKVDNGGAWLRSLGTPPGFALVNDRMRGGSPAQIRVTGAAPGDVLVLGLSLSGLGDGPCLGNQCVALAPPLTTLATAIADAAGAWSPSFALAPGAPVVEVHLQALRIGAGPPSPYELTNTTSTWIEP